MAFSIDELIAMHRFVWETDSLGKILVHNLNSTAESALRKTIKNYIDADSKVFVKTLMINICQRDSSNSGEYTDDRITLEQADKLSDEELNEFACSFLEKNSYLKNDYSKSKSKKKKNEEGNVVATIQYEKRIDARKLDDESNCDLLKRLMHHYRVHQDEKTKKLFNSLQSKNIFSDSLLGLISENRKLSNNLENEIGRYNSMRPPELYRPPENPVHETNRQLTGLGEEISKTSSLIRNMNDTGLQMAVEMAVSNKRTKLYNMILIGIGLLTLVFSAVMSYFSYVSSNESTRMTQDILMKVNTAQETATNEQTKDNEAVHLQLLKINETLLEFKEEQEMSTNKLNAE